MKKCFIVLILVILFLISGCAEVTKTDTISVEARVIDVYRKDSWIQLIPSGSILIPIEHPSEYIVAIEYEDSVSIIDNEELYNKYINRIGETMMVDLVQYYYDNKIIKRELTIDLRS